jgi:hypothetical protein
MLPCLPAELQREGRHRRHPANGPTCHLVNGLASQLRVPTRDATYPNSI